MNSHGNADTATTASITRISRRNSSTILQNNNNHDNNHNNNHSQQPKLSRRMFQTILSPLVSRKRTSLERLSSFSSSVPNHHATTPISSATSSSPPQSSSAPSSFINDNTIYPLQIEIGSNNNHDNDDLEYNFEDLQQQQPQNQETDEEEILLLHKENDGVHGKKQYHNHHRLGNCFKKCGCWSSFYQRKSAAEESSSQQKQVTQARWLLFAAAAFYGTSFACIKSIDETLPVGIVSTLRFALAALATLPWLLAPISTKQTSTTLKQYYTSTTTSFYNSDEWRATLSGFEIGLWESIGYVSQAVGLRTTHTSASSSAFFCSMAVVVVPALDLAITGKRPKLRQILGTGLAVGGIACLEWAGSVDFWNETDAFLLTLIQPVAFGIAFWRTEHAMRKYPNHARRNAAAQLLAVFFISAIYTACVERPGWTPLLQILWTQVFHPISTAISLLWTGFVATALTLYLETVALKTLTAAETALILSTEPLWGAFTAYLLLGETFGPTAQFGGVLVVLGCLLASLE